MAKARAYAAYFDTGGSETHENVLVTAGAVSSADKWSRLDKKWLAVRSKYGVSTLHMAKLAHWQGEYEKWNRDETIRKSFLQELGDIAVREVNKAYVHCLLLRDYREIDKRFMLTEEVGGPYSLLQTISLTDIFEWLRKSRPARDRFGAIVELGDAGQDAFRKYFGSLAGFMPTFQPKRELKSGEPVTPLSVADWIAYEHRLLYERALPLKKIAHPTKWRGSLKILRVGIPFDVKILETPFLVSYCQGMGIRERSTDAV
jgi:hypothetical protein